MNGMEFTTYDQDQDHDWGNCAQRFHGAWWYNKCYNTNPNGLYVTPGTDHHGSMNYQAFRGTEGLRSIKIMFR